VLESVQRIGIDAPFDLRPVHLFDRVAWIGDASLQATVIGQQQQALAVMIQAAGRVEARCLEMIGQDRTVLLRGEPSQDAVGLVEEQKSHARTIP
jgi:hypothetical protein